ncbi:MAG: hypothetical protein ACI3XZ_02620 [Butyricicoccus sp.]
MKLTTPLVASMGALLLVGALFLSLFLSSAPYRPGDVVTPSEATEISTSAEIAGRNLEIVGGVTIDAENVQRVIATLSRMESYTATVTSRLYYGETSGVRTCRQMVKNGAYRVDTLTASGAVDYTELLYEGVYYAWRSGADTWYQGVQGDFTTDQSAMLPTYETVIDLPAEQVTGGALIEENGEQLLTVDTRDGESVGVYKVSVQTGLLRAASFSESGKMIRSVEVTLSAEEPADMLFVLPGQTVPVYGTAEP